MSTKIARLTADQRWSIERVRDRLAMPVTVTATTAVFDGDAADAADAIAAIRADYRARGLSRDSVPRSLAAVVRKLRAAAEPATAEPAPAEPAPGQPRVMPRPTADDPQRAVVTTESAWCVFYSPTHAVTFADHGGELARCADAYRDAYEPGHAGASAPERLAAGGPRFDAAAYLDGEPYGLARPQHASDGRAMLWAHTGYGIEDANARVHDYGTAGDYSGRLDALTPPLLDLAGGPTLEQVQADAPARLCATPAHPRGLLFERGAYSGRWRRIECGRYALAHRRWGMAEPETMSTYRAGLMAHHYDI